MVAVVFYFLKTRLLASLEESIYAGEPANRNMTMSPRQPKAKWSIEYGFGVN